MLQTLIPRLLGWVPVSVRQALIGRPDHPSRIGTLAHDLLNRLPQAESQVFACHGTLAGYRMFVDWSRHRSFVYGTWEPKVVRAITETVKAGMTVIDIGAHIGYYSLLFAKCVGSTGRVFSFEPLPTNFAALLKNIQINNLQNVHPRKQAVFSTAQEMFIAAPDDEPNPGNGSVHREPASNHCRVDAITVDDFCAESDLCPDLLKMDVEGSEYDVLMGAKETISRCKCDLLIELHHFDGNLASNRVPGLLASWNYRIQWLERWELTSFILARAK